MAAFDCEGLAALWDGCESIRERLRDGHGLVRCQNLLKGADANIQACAQNTELLMPCCHRLLASNGKLPEIEALREAVSNVYSSNQRVLDESNIKDTARDIKKMLRFIKRKSNRTDPSTASQLLIYYSWRCCFVALPRIPKLSKNRKILEDEPKKFGKISMSSKDLDFQELCHAFNPDLEAGMRSPNQQTETFSFRRYFALIITVSIESSCNLSRLRSMKSTADRKLDCHRQGYKFSLFASVILPVIYNSYT